MTVLLIGSGAREHAIARALHLGSPEVVLHAAPGNPGIGAVAALHDIVATDPEAVADLAVRLGADLVVIGPEAPLVAGVADAVRAAGVACFGPSGRAAALEGSKSFAKEVMASAGVPTAGSVTCRTVDDVAAAMDGFGAPHVIKDDGLAQGKGVVVTSDRDAALAHAAECLAKGPDTRVVVEEFLDGPEVSLFCVTDGEAIVPLVPAQDFKRALDGDAGPNTGGMGAYTPLPWAPDGLVDEVVATVAEPTVREMARRGIPFVGVLYCGLALTSRGVRVIEFNARFGDPETQVVLARLRTPLLDLLLAAATGSLASLPPLDWSPEAAVGVVVASAGYPAAPRTGHPVTGVDAAAATGAWVLHAGTALAEPDPGSAVAAGWAETAALADVVGMVDVAGPGGAAGGTTPTAPELVSAGGRVLTVVGTGVDLDAARAAAYRGVDRIHLAGSHHRTDIALAAARGSEPGRSQS